MSNVELRYAGFSSGYRWYQTLASPRLPTLEEIGLKDIELDDTKWNFLDAFVNGVKAAHIERGGRLAMEWICEWCPEVGEVIEILSKDTGMDPPEPVCPGCGGEMLCGGTDAFLPAATVSS